MNDLITMFGYDPYYIAINLKTTLGISITKEDESFAGHTIWFYDLS